MENKSKFLLAVEAEVSNITTKYSVFRQRWDSKGQEMEYPLLKMYDAACRQVGFSSEGIRLHVLINTVNSYIGAEYRIALDVPGGVLVIRRDDIPSTSKKKHARLDVLTETPGLQEQFCQ